MRVKVDWETLRIEPDFSTRKAGAGTRPMLDTRKIGELASAIAERVGARSSDFESNGEISFSCPPAECAEMVSRLKGVGLPPYEVTTLEDDELWGSTEPFSYACVDVLALVNWGMNVLLQSIGTGKEPG